MSNKETYKLMLELYELWSELSVRFIGAMKEDLKMDEDDAAEIISGASIEQWSWDKFCKEIENEK